MDSGLRGLAAATRSLIPTGLWVGSGRVLLRVRAGATRRSGEITTLLEGTKLSPPEGQAPTPAVPNSFPAFGIRLDHEDGQPGGAGIWRREAGNIVTGELSCRSRKARTMLPVLPLPLCHTPGFGPPAPGLSDGLRRSGRQRGATGERGLQ